MFGSATLTLLLLFLILGLLTRQTPLFLLALALLLAAGLSKLYDRYCLAGLEYRRRFSRRRAEFGETIELEIEIINRKLLPLAWLEIEDEVPRELPPARGDLYHSHKAGRAILHSLIALRPFERVRRRYPIRCGARGEHVFGPVRLRTGDLFGLVTRELELDLTDALVVYPRVVPVGALGLPARQPLGDRRTRSWLFEDPSRLVGVREYRARDSLRRIHWAASARTQRLQVKVYEPTTSHHLAIFLNLNTTRGEWWGFSYDPDALELAVMAAASLAAWALAAGYQVGLTTNGMHRSARTPVALDPTADPAGLPRLLEALGRLQPFAVRPFAETLAEGGRGLSYGATVVAVTAAFTAADLAALLALRRRGHPTIVLLAGADDALPARAGLVVYPIGPPQGWRQVSELAAPPIPVGVGSSPLSRSRSGLG